MADRRAIVEMLLQQPVEQRRGGLFDGEREAQRDDADGRGAGELGNAAGGEQRRAWQSDLGNRWEGAPGGSSPWSDLVWLPCTDGKARPTQPSLQPLAHGVPGRVGRLRAYGNAIVPALAAEFIKASAGLCVGDDYDARADLAGSIEQGRGG
jgi:DNA (cytosine-5)-methyltransferase 1